MNWKEVAGYEGQYEVSDTGIVRSIDRYIEVKGGTKRFIKSTILKHKINNDGYPILSLTKNKKKRTFYIHRLVALAFLPNLNNLLEVNHKSGDKADNTVENLEWVTHKQNVQHAYDMGLNKNQHGQHHMAVGILDMFLGMVFETIKDWCIARGISYSTGKNILCGNHISKHIDMSQVIKLAPNEVYSAPA